MEPFTTHRGLIAPLDRANVDTDQIIPKQFLKSIQRTGFGENLFYDWRYSSDGSPNPSFPLNQERFRGASILVTRNNFGCGSSREHAVWAIRQYGFRVIVAVSFADIFKNNCSKNSILTVELSDAEVDAIFIALEKNPKVEATASLEEQTIKVHLPKEISFSFEMDFSVKGRLLKGQDDIALTLQYETAIREFESRHDVQLGS